MWSARCAARGTCTAPGRKPNSRSFPMPDIRRSSRASPMRWSGRRIDFDNAFVARERKKTPGGPGVFVSARAEHQPFKHVLMKLLRSLPFSFLPFASALHAFILSCCDILPLGSAGAVDVDAVVVLPFRQSLMNCLCASPFMPLDCVLHVAIFCCCAVIGFLAAVLELAANAGAAATAARDRASASIVERIRMMTLLRDDRPMPAARIYACARVKADRPPTGSAMLS